MDEIRSIIEIAKERGVRDRFRILIGGAPVTQEYCDLVGADAYTDDAAAAAREALRMLSAAG